MPILICSTNHGGCGFIGDGLREFNYADADWIFCPQCGEDHALQLTHKNLDMLTNDSNRELGRKLINNDKSVVAIAQCGCGKHKTPCVHDVALAREQHYKQNNS